MSAEESHRHAFRFVAAVPREPDQEDRVCRAVLDVFRPALRRVRIRIPAEGPQSRDDRLSAARQTLLKARRGRSGSGADAVAWVDPTDDDQWRALLSCAGRSPEVLLRSGRWRGTLGTFREAGATVIVAANDAEHEALVAAVTGLGEWEPLH